MSHNHSEETHRNLVRSGSDRPPALKMVPDRGHRSADSTNTSTGCGTSTISHRFATAMVHEPGVVRRSRSFG